MKTKDELLATGDIPTEYVDVPEWDDRIKIRGLDLESMLIIEQIKDSDRPRVILETVIGGAINEDGTPLFTRADSVALGRKNAAALVRIAAAVGKLSKNLSDGLTDANLQELAKN